jgi:hypothetical protein
MWAGVAVGGIVVLVVLTFVVYFVWTLFTGTSPKGVEFDASFPALLAEGEAFTMTVTVRNLLDRERTFRSLDFDNSLLKGFLVEKLEPAARESSSAYGTTAHHYQLSIAPRDSVSLTLSCRALHPGEHSGDIMVFVDQANWKNLSKVFRIVVK